MEIGFLLLPQVAMWIVAIPFQTGLIIFSC